MADFHKILKAEPLGEPWAPNKPGAKPLQRYWCQVEGQDWAVSINKQVGNTLTAGMHVYGELTYAKSQKGTEYWKFESKKIPDDVERPTDDPSTPAQASAQAAVGDNIPAWFVPFGNVLIDLQKDMKLLKGDDFDEPASEEPKAEPKEPEPKLNDIFGE